MCGYRRLLLQRLAQFAGEHLDFLFQVDVDVAGVAGLEVLKVVLNTLSAPLKLKLPMR